VFADFCKGGEKRPDLMCWREVENQVGKRWQSQRDKEDTRHCGKIGQIDPDPTEKKKMCWKEKTSSNVKAPRWKKLEKEKKTILEEKNNFK